MSKKHDKLMESGRDHHHYYWPKKFYGKNRIIYLSYAMHHNYHNYFMAQCKCSRVRVCHSTFCRFEEFCCYWQTLVDFPNRIPWKEANDG